jgi:4'-phosphopantetheinyl transferase EntD
VSSFESPTPTTPDSSDEHVAQAGRQAGRQAARQAARQAGRQAGRQAARQAARQTDAPCRHLKA